MSKSSALASTRPVFAPAFRAWMGAGRRRPALWRVLIGVVIIVLFWSLTSVGVFAVGTLIWSVQSDVALGQLIDELGLFGGFPMIAPVMQALLVLGSFSGMWIGTWVALRVLHKRSMGSMLAAPGRWRWRDFWLGAGIAIVFFTAFLLLALITGSDLPFSLTGIASWGWLLVPMLALVAVQSCGEEVILRGYLQQQLAGRCRNPLIWFILPSLLFGVLHWQPGWTGIAYVAITTTFGLAAAAIVWRTGSLAGAMGLHFANNAMHFALLGPAEMVDALFNQEWLEEVATPVDFLVDGAFFFVVLIWVLSPWTPFRALRRDRRGG